MKNQQLAAKLKQSIRKQINKIMIKRKVTIVALLALSATFGSSAIASQNRAKDMYYQQLQTPAQSINNGIQCSIELIRKGRRQIVDNRYAFKSGDKIRFKITPNFDGYAYILMAKGSSGAQKILFPTAAIGSSNKVARNRTYSLPVGQTLVFDKRQGLETVQLILSRSPVSQAALLNNLAAPHTVVAAQQQKQQQLAPSDPVLIAFSDDTAAPMAFVDDKSLDSNTEDSGFSKDLFAEAIKPHRAVAKAPARKRKRPANSVTSMPPTPAVFIVGTAPSENLVAEILLSHN